MDYPFFLGILEILLFILFTTLIIHFALPPVREVSSKQLHTATSRYPHFEHFFGLDLLFKKWQDTKSHRFLSQTLKRHDQYGPTFLHREWGTSVINTIEPENIHSVTTKCFEEYGIDSWATLVKKYMGPGVLVNDGIEWKISRELVKPMFRRNRSKNLIILEEHVSRLLAYIDGYKGSKFNFRTAASRFFMDITTELLFGKSTKTLSTFESDGEEFFHLADQMEILGAEFMEFGPLASIVYLFKRRKIFNIIHGLQDFFARAVSTIYKDSDNQGENKDDILHHLARTGLSPDVIQGEVTNLFFAAFDTSTALLTNLFDVLGRRQDIMDRLRDEIEEYVGLRNPTEIELGKMVYLKWTIFETLRLYSPVTSHTRRVLKSTFLPLGGGINGDSPLLLHPGTRVIWNTYSLNRSKEIYGDDSSQFRPERWGENNGALQSNKAWIPFGLGPRNCPGQTVAILNVGYSVVRLLQHFKKVERISTNKHEDDFKEGGTVTFFNGNGTMLKMFH